jgi:1,4-dihydroxy-2-naphthoate octaprenyltransferase
MERLGPPRAAQSGWLTPAELRSGIAVALALSALAGCYLVWVGGAVMAPLWIAAMVSAVAYTAGPCPLGYAGLGDLFVFLFFGLVAVPATAYVQAGAVPPVAWWASIPVGGLATAILVVNNLRDRHTDRRAGKRTLAVRLGHRAVRLEYTVLLGIAYAVPVALAWRGASPFLLLPLAPARRAASAARAHPRRRRAQPGARRLCAAARGLQFSPVRRLVAGLTPADRGAGGYGAPMLPKDRGHSRHYRDDGG